MTPKNSAKHARVKEPDSVNRRDLLRQASLSAGAMATTAFSASTATGATAQAEIVSWDADDLAQRIKAKDVS